MYFLIHMYFEKTKINHGLSHCKLYSVWNTMRHRCYNEKNKKYKIYGARGITVCDEWKNNYIAFREWALSHGYAEGLTLDRKNVEGNYCPENCRWVTQKIQQRNRRNNRLIEYKGQRKLLLEWCEEFNLPFKTVQARLRVLKWSIDKALNTPIEYHRNYKR